MGNISNPLANRWGLNIFWYHFWYSDNIYSKNIHQDKLILDLIKIYLKYGLNFKKNIFINNYWFINGSKTISLYKYYRWTNFKNLITNYVTKYKFRIQSNEIFKTRFSIFRYNHWLILLAQWFVPNKRKTTSVNKKKTLDFKNFYYSYSKKDFNLQRLSLLQEKNFLSNLTYTFKYDF